MSLSRFRTEDQLKAVRTFTDRKLARQSFRDAVGRLDENPLQVLMYYGVGGIGKTRLLRFLQGELEKEMEGDAHPGVRTLYLSLDAYEFTSPASVLLSIRNQLGLRADLFDYALLKYWTGVGMSLIELRKSGVHDGSLVWDFLDLLGNLGGAVIPMQLVRRALSRVQQTVLRRYSEFSDEIERIDGYSEAEIAERLPYYLGLAVSRAASEEEIRHVFFIDSFETLAQRIRPAASMSSPDEWVREFIGASEHGLFVVGGREYLRWVDLNPGWADCLEQHILGQLADTDADYFLAAVPIEDPGIRAAIVQVARGLPLYLDLCVTIYLKLREQGRTVTVADFQIAEEEVIRRFLSHLSDSEREATRVAALLAAFDLDLFQALVRSFNIGFPVSRFGDFVDAAFVTAIDADAGIYKVHDNIRAYMDSHAPAPFRQQVVRAALRHVADTGTTRSASHLASHLERFSSILAAGDGCSSAEVEDLLDIAATLVDRGYWIEVARAAEWEGAGVTADPDPDALAAAFSYLRALCQRRRGQLDEAEVSMNRITGHFHLLGRHADAARFHRVNIMRLRGDYGGAEAGYRSLLDGLRRQAPPVPVTERVARQFADVLFLRGRFREAHAQLQALLAASASRLQRAETLRVIGHIHRFNFDLDAARLLYEEALELAEAEEAMGLIGRLHTNLAETLCWTDPAAATGAGRRAVEANRQLEAPIEVGKAEAALAIAAARLPNQSSDSAARHAQEAIRIQEKTGYRSGVLFGRVAASMVHLAAGNENALQAELQEIDRLVEALDVYHFVKMPIHIIRRNESEIDRLGDNVEWLDFDNTRVRCAVVAEGFGPGFSG
jgi:tetratricopeptide (TPR) repeat protein/Cdc6-like AAA superfamily ATPase